MRMIPQIDRRPSIVSFVEAPLGKLLAFALFSFGLYCANFPEWATVSVILFVLTWIRTPRHRLIAFAIANVSLWILLGTLFGTYFVIPGATRIDLLELLLDPLLQPSYENMLLVRTAIASALIILCLLFLRAARWPMFRNVPVILLLSLVFLSLLGSWLALRDFPILKCLLFGLIVAFAKALWPLGYLVLDQDFIRERNPLLKFGAFNPFWNQSWIGIVNAPKGYLGLEETVARKSKEFAISQLSGLKLLYWSAFLGVLAKTIRFATFQIDGTEAWTSHIPSLGLYCFDHLPLWFYARLHLPLYERWIAVLLNCLAILMYIASGTGITISIIRFAGFWVPRQVYRPLDATSFGDFLRRIYFYYIELLIKFFFIPFYKLSRHLFSRKRTRVFATNFATVLVGGATVHFTRELHALTQGGLPTALQLLRGRLGYFLGLAILCGLFGGISPTSKEPKSRTGLVQLGFVFLYFVAYSLCMALQTRWEYLPDWRNQRDFFLALFGIPV